MPRARHDGPSLAIGSGMRGLNQLALVHGKGVPVGLAHSPWAIWGQGGSCFMAAATKVHSGRAAPD